MVYFSRSGRNHIFLKYLFDQCTIVWIRVFSLQLSISCQRVSHSVLDVDFFVINSVILFQIAFIVRATKTNSKYFNETL